MAVVLSTAWPDLDERAALERVRSRIGPDDPRSVEPMAWLEACVIHVKHVMGFGPISTI